MIILSIIASHGTKVFGAAEAAVRENARDSKGGIQ
jgi:hypothetical protein